MGFWRPNPKVTTRKISPKKVRKMKALKRNGVRPRRSAQGWGGANGRRLAIIGPGQLLL